MTVYGFDPHMTVDGAWQLSADVVKAGELREHGEEPIERIAEILDKLVVAPAMA